MMVSLHPKTPEKNSSVLLSPTIFFVTATTAITNVSSVILLKSDGPLMSLPYLNFHLECFIQKSAMFLDITIM